MSDAAEPDTALDDGAPVDGSVGPPADGRLVDAAPAPCDLTRPFGPPTLVAGVNGTADESQAAMSDDELTIYVASSRPGGPGKNDMYVATRATKTASFGALTLIAGVNSAGNDGSVTLTRDGLALYIASDRATTATYDLYVATRPTATAAFGTPTLIAGLSTTTSLDGSPYINGDGTVLYFDSDRGGTRDIFRASRPSANGAFGAPALVGELNSPTADDKYPVVSGDELSVYFGSDRPGSAGFDIWEAHRTTTGDGFGTPRLSTNVNSTATDLPVWISPDGCRLLLSSDRAGVGGRDLYLATRPQ
jgi:Tol biopolymer transport system component